MTPTTNQIFGRWTSECTASDKLFDGCTVTFFFDQLPFEGEPATLTITATENKEEKHIVKSAPFTIEGGDDFKIVLPGMEITCQSFQEDSFLAEFSEYGSMILQKRN